MNYRKISIIAAAVLLSGASVFLLLRKPNTETVDKSIIDKRHNTLILTTNYLENSQVYRHYLISTVMLRLRELYSID